MELNLEYLPRETTGTVAGRKLRRTEDMVPAIIYGGDKGPEMIKISRKQLTKISENESFFSQIILLVPEKDKDKSERAVLKSLQRHAFKRRFLHADFMRIREDVKITMRVPLHFLNEDVCIGVKQQGGAVSHEMTELEISCLPKDLPPFIEIDIAQVELNQILHMSDIKLPAGVEATVMLQDKEGDHSHDLPVVRVIEQRIEEIEEEEEAVSDEEGAVPEEGAEESTDEEGKEGDQAKE